MIQTSERMAKKITLYEFRGLSNQEQYHLVFNEGTFFDSKIYGDQRFALYALDMFFVEVEYDNKANKIISKTAFVTGEKLNKYSQVDIDNLRS